MTVETPISQFEEIWMPFILIPLALLPENDRRERSELRKREDRVQPPRVRRGMLPRISDQHRVV